MSDAGDDGTRDADPEREADDPEREVTDGDDVESLRAAVEDEYDFENFGPAEMAQMSIDEWQAAFDPETWITGEELIDRVEADLTSRVADREVFARIERYADPPRLLAYAESSYAMVYPDGSVEGEGTVLRDVEPTVALCSMESYDVPEAPTGRVLPEPGDVPEGGGELGNNVLQVVAGIQILAALVLFGAGALTFGDRSSNWIVMFVAGLGFLVAGLFLFLTVANARLSDSFRAEEYRDRLRNVGLADGERPEFLPPPPEEADEAAGLGSRVRDATGSDGGEPRSNGPDGDGPDDSEPLSDRA